VCALACVWICLWVVASAHGQAGPIGPDFFIGGYPEFSHCPSVAIDNERWFAAAFVTYFAFMPEACGFSDSGVWQGCQWLDDQVWDFLSQRPVDIATVGTDDFLVVWEAYQYQVRTSIRGRRMSAHVVLLTGPFDVVTSEVDHPRDPQVAKLRYDVAILVWVDDSSDGSDNSGSSIQARLFLTDGSQLGPRFQVNTTTLGDQTRPDVESAPDGGFLVTWQSASSAGSDDSGTSIQLRRFDAAGDPIGSDEQVNTYISADQRNPRVACAGDGSFVVVWESDGSSGNDQSSLSIQARIFDGDGTPLGLDFQVNSLVEGSQAEPDVEMMGDGRFEAVWADGGSSIQRQTFTADGGMVGSQSQVDTSTGFSAYYPTVAMTPGGDFIVVWDSSVGGIRGRIFRLLFVFADGFESGDTSAWSATLP
jgi:hypothetical protein